MPGLNWFEQNPKKTIAALMGLMLVLFTLVAEKILAYRNRDQNSGIQRSIRLREYRPYFSQELIPPEAELAIADNLERKPYPFRIDGNGFIIPSQIHANPELSLVFLGGSSTACGYMGEEQRFPYVTGRLLEQQTGKKINAYNSGVGGNNSLHSLNILLNKVIPLKPEVVLLCHNINDLTTLLLEGTYWSANPSRSTLMVIKPSLSGSLKEMRDLLIPNLSQEVNRLSRACKEKIRGSGQRLTAGDEFAGVRDRKILYDEAQLRQTFRSNLQLFIDICRARQIRPVLLTQAGRLTDIPEPIIKKSLQDLEKRQGLSYKTYKGLFDGFNEEIRKTGRENGVLVIDLAAKIPAAGEYLYDIVHFTPSGSQMAAEIIAAALLSDLPGLNKN